MILPSVLAGQRYDQARPATAPTLAPPARSEAALGAQLGGFAAHLHQSDRAAMSTMVSGADPHALVEAIAATELAVDTAVAVRNKVVEAYLEILRMPV
ncbi:MAG: flagellar hook-basal body complex protein FliE [Roseinatronobacter sp.]